MTSEQRAKAREGLSKVHPRDDRFLRGVSLGLFASAERPKARLEIYEVLLREIQALGATDVQIVVRWGLPDARSSALAPAQGLSPSDEELGGVLRFARGLGLRTSLMPIVHLQRRARGEWRGTLAPEDLEGWWRAYDRFILHHAKIARAEGVYMLSVGSELVSLEAQEARWRALIAKVRAVYPGKLSYSANWDHFEPVRIWDAVDLIGISAYPPLSRLRDPDQAALEAGWAGFQQRLRRVASGRPFVLTEVGYPSHDRAAQRPWDQRARSSPDLALQLRCYRALFERWNQEPGLAGLFIWNWFGEGGPKDTGYTPRGKPAEEVLRRWYKR